MLNPDVSDSAEKLRRVPGGMWPWPVLLFLSWFSQGQARDWDSMFRSPISVFIGSLYQEKREAENYHHSAKQVSVLTDYGKEVNWSILEFPEQGAEQNCLGVHASQSPLTKPL